MPGQRPCQPRPPVPLAFPSPPQPMCGQSRPRAADPAVNPAWSSGPAVPSPLGKTLRALNTSHDSGTAPKDAPEAVGARGPGCPGSLALPHRQFEDPPGGHVGSPGPGCQRIQGGRGCNALPSARRAPGRSVLLVRPPRVPVASQPRRAFRTLLSGAARTGRCCRSHGATSRPRRGAYRRAETSGAHLGWRFADAKLQVRTSRCAHLGTHMSDLGVL